jgi:hypothetical protein
MSGLTSTERATIAFETGLDPNGTLNSVNGWRWDGNTPAGYGSYGSAHKWAGGAAGTSGGTVTYYFDPGSNWSAAEQTMLTAALALWSAVANISFTAVATPAAASMVFYRYGSTTAASQGVSLIAGQTYLSAVYVPNSPGSTTVPQPGNAYLSMDTSVYGWQDITSFAYAGGYAVGTVVHEMGHLLGLYHTGPYNGNVNPATEQYNATDTKLWSVMSYISPTDTSAKYYSDYSVTGTNWTVNGVTYTPTTFMPLDILAAQRLYGTPARHR